MSNSPSNAAIADKIRALLTKTVANGATEAEAANALSKAAELMAKHNLARAVVEANAPTHGYEKGVAHETQGMPLHFVFAARVIEVACEVHVCIIETLTWYGRDVRFEVFGDPENVEAGTVMLKYLAGVFADLWIGQRARGDASARSEAGYYEGLRAGLLVRLEREKKKRERKSKKTGTALAVSQARLDAAFTETYPGVKDLEVAADEKAFRAGARDSHQISLRRKVGGG